MDQHTQMKWAITGATTQAMTQTTMESEIRHTI